jgi:hypothetical protein
VPIVFFASCTLGGMEETVGKVALGYMYNDLGGSDENYNIRNFINGLGFMCYSSGSLKVGIVHNNLFPHYLSRAYFGRGISTEIF